MTNQLNRVSGLVVDGLFGREEQVTIPLDALQPTVLTGMNGTGKSTLLRLVNAVSVGDVGMFLRAPLERFRLHFEGLPTFEFRRLSERQAFLRWGDQEYVAERPALADGLPPWALLILESNQYDLEATEAVLREAAQNANLPFAEYRRVRELIQSAEPALEFGKPPWQTELQTAFPVLFITDQRLVVEAPKHTSAAASRTTAPDRVSRRLAVDAATSDIARRIRDADTAYARASQQQDRLFPRDVIQALKRVSQVSLEEVEQLIGEVDARRNDLRAVGLLDLDDSFEPALTAENLQVENARPVMATFLRTTIAKLQVLQDLENRLSTFKRFLDDRFTPKAALLSRQDGLRFGLPEGQALAPGQLSSGEQQMLVLAYEILFRAEPNTLVIVDEPELSLHVLWQDTLIEDLTSMGLAAGLQFLMATHSAVILAGHPQLERSLDAISR